MGYLKYVAIGVATLFLIVAVVCFTLLTLCHYEVPEGHCKTCSGRAKRDLTLGDILLTPRDKRDATKGAGNDGCKSDRITRKIAEKKKTNNKKAYGAAGGILSGIGVIVWVILGCCIPVKGKHQQRRPPQNSANNREESSPPPDKGPFVTSAVKDEEADLVHDYYDP